MYYRICVMDAREARGGKAIEEIGTYDPMVREKEKRVTINGDRYDYWIGVGAKPTDQVKKLADKFKGKVPTVRMDERKSREGAAMPARAEARRVKIEPPPAPVEEAPVEEASAEEAASGEAVADAGATPESEASAEAGSTEPAEATETKE